MRLKLLKLKAKEVMSSGAVATSTSGNVIDRNCWSTPAPSMPAASLRSPGIDCSAQVQTRNM